MTYKELIMRGKEVFNFHPDSDIESVGELLSKGRKALGVVYYNQAMLHMAEIFSVYIEENKEN